MREQCGDALLLFRQADFYEAFGPDAVTLSRSVGLTLCSRQGIPMAGFPYHQMENCLAKLIQLGKWVAICEQDEMTATLQQPKRVENRQLKLF